MAYFPVNLILKETLMVWTDRWALVRYLSNKKRIFKIRLLEPSEVETDPKTDGQKIAQTGGQKIVQTDGNNLLNISIWCHTFLTKKEFLKSTVRTVFDTDYRFCLSVLPYVKTDGQTKRTKDMYLMSYLSIKREF